MGNSSLTPELRALVDRQAIVECLPGTVAAFTAPIGCWHTTVGRIVNTGSGVIELYDAEVSHLHMTR
jgi:hypothetical protein